MIKPLYKYLAININTKLIMLLAIILFQSCKTQQLLTKTSLPKVENQLKGELDYANGGFELVQWQNSGDEITLGRIDETGEIHFSLPEYDIKALGKNHMPNHFESGFNMLRCKGRGDFDMVGNPKFKTPYDDVYSQLYAPMYIKKYGVNIAYISPVSDEKMLLKESWDKVIGNKYYWMYIDRALDYKATCIRESFKSTEHEIERSADIQLKKGWNFIKANLVEIQNYGEKNEHTMAKTFLYTLSSPESKDVKWYLTRVMDDEKILAAKKEYGLTPITKEQFEKWAPNTLGDLSIETKEYGIPAKGQTNKNNIHLSYVNETQKREIDLYVVDCSKSPVDLEMVDFAYAMENDGKEEKDIKPYITQYNEAENVTMLLYKVGDSMFVEASAVNINGEDLWVYIEKLNVEKLLK